MSAEESGSDGEGKGREDRKERDADENRESAPEPHEDEKPAESAEDDEGDGGRRPISVRDLMPSPPTRPSRRAPERVERQETEAGEGEDDGGRPEEGDGADGPDDESDAADTGAAASVPTPVRVAMDAPPPGDSRPPDELPSRRFEVGGEEWIVRISGRTVTGTRPDPGALLMQLSFFRPEEPDTPVRNLLTVDRSLDALYHEDLLDFFERSRPAEPGGSTGSEG